MSWRLDYREFKPGEERLREALCTLGNGYFATRGAAPESAAGEFHYPGTYLAGGYDRQATEIAGREIENEGLVNLPNWLALAFRVDGADWFDLEAVELLEYRQVLDFSCGMLERRVRFRDAAGRHTRFAERRALLALAHAAPAQRLGELRLGHRRGHAQDRLVGEKERAFRHGVHLAGEAQALQVVQRLLEAPRPPGTRAPAAAS